MSFAGTNARTADTKQLSVARQRLAEGDDAENVRQDTGWHIGVDSKWRFEIDDSGAVWNPGMTQIGLKAINAIESGNIDDLSNPRPYRLKELLVHSALFAAYPELGEISLESGEIDSEGACYLVDRNTIRIDTAYGLRSDESVLYSLHHELQHVIQDIEDFVRGGSADEIARAPQSYVSQDTIEYAKSLPAYDLTADKDDFIKSFSRMRLNHPMLAYQALGGEVEARNTQARQTLTVEQRKSISPSQTQDIPDSELIVIINDKVVEPFDAIHYKARVGKLQQRLADTENEFGNFRGKNSAQWEGPEWQDVSKRAAAIRVQLSDLTGNPYGRTKAKITGNEVPGVIDDKNSSKKEKNVELSVTDSLYRGWMTNVRGGWTQDKIRKELKLGYANSGTSGKFVHREIAKFESVDAFAQNIFWHGTGGYVGGGLKASITMSERQAESRGGGGYGERYWGISLSKSKNMASQFVGQSRFGTVYPVILKSGASVISMPDISDASELEDIIGDLWNRGIDAVKIGKWDKEHSEQEIVILNPKAIYKYDVSESFAVFNQKRMEELTEDQIEEIYTTSVAMVPRLDEIKKLPTRAEKDAALNDIAPLKFRNDSENPSVKQQVNAAIAAALTPEQLTGLSRLTIGQCFGETEAKSELTL